MKEEESLNHKFRQLRIIYVSKMDKAEFDRGVCGHTIKWPFFWNIRAKLPNHRLFDGISPGAIIITLKN